MSSLKHVSRYAYFGFPSANGTLKYKIPREVRETGLWRMVIDHTRLANPDVDGFQGSLPETGERRRFGRNHALMEQAQEVESFFTDSWTLYRKIVVGDLMQHALFGSVMGERLRDLDRAFDILDLGCGDGTSLAGALRGTSVRSWEGVDLSKEALASAKQTMQDKNWTWSVRQADLTQRLQEPVPGIVYSGYAFHHLSNREKADAFRCLAGSLRDGGVFFLLDLARRHDEDRNQYLQRYDRHVRSDWSTLSEQEMDIVQSHMSECDFPETVSELADLGRQAGFETCDLLCRDSREFFALYRFCGS